MTNIDPEHLEHYGSFDRVKDAFVEFVENVPFYGIAVLCVDHPEVQNIIGRSRDRRTGNVRDVGVHEPLAGDEPQERALNEHAPEHAAGGGWALRL